MYMYIRYVTSRINQCSQLALDGVVVDRDVDYTSNDVGSSPTCTFYLDYFPPFSFSSCLLFDSAG